jgi:hypothetical protein
MTQYLLTASLSCIVLLLSIYPTWAQGETPSVVEQCAALLPADRPIPSGADAPSIRIVAPREGDVIYGGEVAVSIETENFDLTAEARHWHLWIDGQLMGMVYQDVGIIDLTPGTHQLCVSMGNTDHADLGIPDGITITVQQETPGIPTPTLSITREEAPVLAEPGPSPAQIVMIVGLGLLAAVGGWWFGSRLPKRQGNKFQK